MKIRLKVDSRDNHAYQYFGQPADLPQVMNFDDSSIPERVQPVGDVKCTCYTVEYIARNLTKEQYDINELFSRIPSSILGANPRDVLGEVIKNGLKLVGGGYVKPFKSYRRADTGMFDAFDNTRQIMTITGQPVAIWTYWYTNWLNLGPGAIMPPGTTASSAHMYAGKGWGWLSVRIVNGEPMMVIEWWGGYEMYMPRETFNAAVGALGCGTAVLLTEELDQKIQINLLQKMRDALLNVYLLIRQLFIVKNLPPPPETPTVPPEAPKPPVVKTPSEKLYDTAYSLLGKHIFLDKSVPKNLGCATSMSYVLKQAGYNIPKGGYSGTASLYTWLKNNFEKITTPEVGCVCIFVTGEGRPGTNGHVAVVGKENMLSNDSDTGLFSAHWTIPAMLEHYKSLGYPVHYFRPR